MTWGLIGAAAVSTVGGSLMNSGNGGSGGGSAQPVYQPLDQPGRDQNFLWSQNAYGNQVQNQFAQTDPQNYRLFQDQMNNPYNGYYQGNANRAGDQYGVNADQMGQGANSMFANANSAANWGNQIQNGMISNAPQIQQGFNGMMNLADQSNQTYAGLMNYQRGQLGNVQGASNNLYGGGNAVMNTAFDPQNALYNRTQQQVVDQTRAGEYARGIQMSPAGASVEANALGNFNIDWQNQQLARQSQGLNAAQGAYGAGQGMNNSYTSNMAGLQSGQGQDYGNLVGGATTMLDNFGNAQANIMSTTSGANARNFATASTLGDQAAQSRLQQGQVPYGANQAIYGNQNTALQNYNGNSQQYLQGMNQLQSNDLSYMNFGQGAQNQAFNQNAQNNQLANQYAQQYAGPVGQAVKGAWNWMNSGPQQSYNPGQYSSQGGDTYYGGGQNWGV